jgi:hypothetical protein
VALAFARPASTRAVSNPPPHQNQSSN